MQTPNDTEPQWLTDLRKDVMLAKMTHNFTLSRDELIYLINAHTSSALTARDTRMLLDWIEEAVEYVGCATSSPSLERDGRKILAAMRGSN